MGALKAGEVDAFLRAPDLRKRLLLVYGPDVGLVAERADALARLHLGAGADDPFALVRLEADLLASDPGRLADEVASVPMFGGERVVRARTGARSIQPAVEAAFALPQTQAVLIVEAGELKPSATLRKLFESDRRALTLPCFPDERAALERIVSEELNLAGLAITKPARETLLRGLGGDRLASRQEIRKLALYCHGRDSIGEDDVLAVCGDASATTFGDAVDAMAVGDAALLLAALQRLGEEGIPRSVLAGRALAHLLRIQTARLHIDRGRTVSEAIRHVVPTVVSRSQPSFQRQLVLWTAESLTKAARLLDDAVLEARRRPALADAIAEQAMLAVARGIARKGAVPPERGAR